MAGSNFVDYVKIFARSGHGGAGSCHFRREKFVAFGGPDGGDGGKGGSIILQGDSQYWTLIHLKYKRHQFAEDGENGHGARSTGADAKDIIIPVPLGTVAKQVFTDEETGETYTEVVGEVTEHGEQLVLLKGGRGGLGNWHFRTATNQTPRYAQPGEEGQEGAFILELKVLADVGLVGFPNAGKSTLLSVVSAAKPKIANYAFTTLEPNLGIVSVRDDHSFVMADIPGIIEGAHEGRGLGTRFLRHIERNSVLLFMVPADSDDIAADYEILLGELTQYNPELLDKQRLLAITKCDMLDDELIEQMRAHLPEGIESIFISSVATRITIDLIRTTARAAGRNHNGNAFGSRITNAGLHGGRDVTSTETFDHDTKATAFNGKIDVIAIATRHGRNDIDTSRQFVNGIGLAIHRLTTHHDTVTVAVAQRTPPRRLKRGRIG